MKGGDIKAFANVFPMALELANFEPKSLRNNSARLGDVAFCAADDSLWGIVVGIAILSAWASACFLYQTWEHCEA